MVERDERRQSGSVPTSSPAPAELTLEADQAIASLYAAHWSRLVRLAWLLVHDQGLAEDVVQDAFVGTHRRWAAIRDSGRVVGYLHTAVINGCRSAQRHRTVVDRQLLRDAGGGDVLGRLAAHSAEDQAIASAERDRLLGALGELPLRQREVLVLRYYADLSEAQIAHVLGIAPGSVKAHAHRGLATLRHTLHPARELP